MMLMSKESTLADLRKQMPELKQAVMRGKGRAQISARLGKVPENDPNGGSPDYSLPLRQTLAATQILFLDNAKQEEKPIQNP